MALIGIFSQTENGFRGHIQTLLISAPVAIIPIKEKSSKQFPDYRINLDHGDKEITIGSGWIRRSNADQSYVSVQIDDPVLERPILANLILANEKEAIHHLYWSRKSEPVTRI